MYFHILWGITRMHCLTGYQFKPTVTCTVYFVSWKFYIIDLLFHQRYERFLKFQTVSLSLWNTNLPSEYLWWWTKFPMIWKIFQLKIISRLICAFIWYLTRNWCACSLNTCKWFNGANLKRLIDLFNQKEMSPNGLTFWF